MVQQDAPKPKKDTDKLIVDTVITDSMINPKVDYWPFPHSSHTDGAEDRPVWRVRFDLAADPSVRFGLELNDEVIFGRGRGTPNVFDLSPYDAIEMGVSRHHAKLRPTATGLYVLDMGSTNGTLRNGQSIGVNTPYGLVNGDTLTLGKLQFVIRIMKRPTGQTGALRTKADLADAFTAVAKSITSQLNLDEVLNQVAQAAMALTEAGETGIWLVDEASGELYLETQRGIQAEGVSQLRIPVTGASPVAKVMQSGQPLRVQRKPGGEQIKVKTGYLVQGLAFVPISLGGITFGVLAAAHHEEEKTFQDRDVRLLESIADFAAIAIQNARTFQSTDKALTKRMKELESLNELSNALNATLELTVIHDVIITHLKRQPDIQDVMLWLYDESTEILAPFDDSKETREKIRRTGNQYPGTAQRVLKTGKPLVSRFIDMDEGYKDAEGISTSQIMARSIVGLPLKTKGSTTGVLILVTKQATIRDDDLARLHRFANPVVMVIENANLYAQSEHARATISATANTLQQPLLILDDNGAIMLSNEAAKKLVENNMSELFEGLSESVGNTRELTIDGHTYLTTVEHSENVGTIVIMQDISYVKQLEQEQAELIRTLSHDLKSPLTSVKGWAHLARIGKQRPDKPIDFYGRIEESADRMLDMIKHLLNSLTVKEMTLTELPKVPCEFQEIVNSAVSDLKGAAMGKSIQVNISSEGTPDPILGNAKRLYHMVLNLLDNAIKYSPENAVIDIAIIYQENEVLLQIADTGPGIPEEELPHIFERYFRGAKQATSTHGTGIGLSVVKTVAKEHGGDVTASNREESGALFEVRLPGGLIRPTDGEPEAEKTAE